MGLNFVVMQDSCPASCCPADEKSYLDILLNSLHHGHLEGAEHIHRAVVPFHWRCFATSGSIEMGVGAARQMHEKALVLSKWVAENPRERERNANVF